MQFKVINGKIPYIMVAGSDHVSGEMPQEEAEKLYAAGTKRASNRFPGYPVCVDGKWFFAATQDAPAKKRKKTNA